MLFPHVTLKGKEEINQNVWVMEASDEKKLKLKNLKMMHSIKAKVRKSGCYYEKKKFTKQLNNIQAYYPDSTRTKRYSLQ